MLIPTLFGRFQSKPLSQDELYALSLKREPSMVSKSLPPKSCPPLAISTPVAIASSTNQTITGLHSPPNVVNLIATSTMSTTSSTVQQSQIPPGFASPSMNRVRSQVLIKKPPGPSPKPPVLEPLSKVAGGGGGEIQTVKDNENSPRLPNPNLILISPRDHQTPTTGDSELESLRMKIIQLERQLSRLRLGPSEVRPRSSRELPIEREKQLMDKIDQLTKHNNELVEINHTLREKVRLLESKN